MGRGAPADAVGALKRVWIGTAVAAVGALAVVLVLATRGSGPQLEGSGIRTSFEHSVVGFGDRVHAHAVVVLDGSVAKGARMNVSVAPLAQLGPAHVSSVWSDGRRALTYDVDAACIYEECVGKGSRKLIHLPDVTVTRPGGGVLLSAPWPPLDVRGRVVAADLNPATPPLKADVVPPRVDYRVTPSTLATLLTVLAGLLAVAGIALAGRQLVALRRERAAWAEPLTELERALALARDAESRSAPDRRRALALLERLLRPRDEHLAREARDLAWSSPPPGAEELDDLVSEVESKVSR
jgi:hypothetical protein